MTHPPAKRARPFRRGLMLALVAATLLPLESSHTRSAAASSAPPNALRAWQDPALPMLRRTDDYLQRFEVNGVTMDWRYSVIPSEEIRQTVVCQLLAYVELARIDQRSRLRLEIARHADFLLGRLSEIRSNSPFDGMLAYSLLGAYEITSQRRFLDAATLVMNDLLAIPTSQCVLNGGLMVAMATAEYSQLTGDAVSLQKTHDIIAQLTAYQNADGSFPHWCWGSRDIHYTSWMAMELIHIGRLVNDPLIPPFLSSMSAFLEGRIAPNGQGIYQEPCPGGAPACTLYYYSRMTGCSYDLDSRGWTVEPMYCGLLFDREGSSQYQPVMTFLDSLENGGTIPDLYGYWPPPSDPEYPWTTADTSVVCMSINLWALATEAAERIRRGVPVNLVLDDLIDTTTVVPPKPPLDFVATPIAVRPNPARGVCAMSFTLASPRRGSLFVLDAGGRKVRTLQAGDFAAGANAPSWDGRDDMGRAMPGGVYFARLRLSGGVQTSRFVYLR